MAHKCAGYDITSCFHSSRPRNVIEYCIIVRKTGSISKELNISASVSFGTGSPLMTHRISAEMFKFRGAAFCLAPPFGGFLGVSSCANSVYGSET